MEYGLIPKLDQFVDNKSIEIQKVQSSNETTKIGQRDELQEIRQEAIDKQKELSDVKKLEEQQIDTKYEVVLSNMNFGFNEQSKDFFVKVVRGDMQNQYPTEEMMKMKAYMMSLNEAS